MNEVLRIAGSIAYTVLIPVFRIVARHSERTRIMVVRDNKVLLVKNIIGNGRWTLPGGGLHKAEQPAVGAARELREETGLYFLPKDFVAAGLHKYEYRGITFKYHLFVVRDTSDQAVRRQARELLAAEWIERKEFNNYTISPVVTTAVKHWPK